MSLLREVIPSALLNEVPVLLNRSMVREWLGVLARYRIELTLVSNYLKVMGSIYPVRVCAVCFGFLIILLIYL